MNSTSPHHHAADLHPHTDTEPDRPKLRITPEALLETHRIGSPQIHPDGRRVVFEVDETDFAESKITTHLWLTERFDPADLEPSIEAESVEQVPPGPEDLTRQLTYGAEGEWDPQWSPDGRYVAFLSDRPDPSCTDEEVELTTQIWVLPIDGGEARKVTQARDGVLFYRWSPDAASLLFAAAEPEPATVDAVTKEDRDRRKIDATVEPEVRRPRRIWSVPVEDHNSPALVWRGDSGLMEFAISPEGTNLCVATNYTGDPNDYHLCDLWIVPVPDRDNPAPNPMVPYRLTERRGDKSSLRWAPNGSSIAFVSWSNPELSFSTQAVYIVDLPDNNQRTPDVEVCRPVAQGFDYDVSDLQWCDLDAGLYGIASIGTGSELIRVSPDTKVLTASTNGPKIVRSDLSVHSSGCAVWVEESVNSMPDLVYRDSMGATHSLTRINAEFADRYLLPVQKTLSWHGTDGLLIEGLFTYPAGWSEGEPPPPMVVQIHGGPKGRAASTLLDYYMSAVWVASGYAVLAPNYRGSEGYGGEFAVASRRDIGGADYLDISAGVDRCIELGIADKARIGIMGGSYGGFLTNRAVTQTNRFAAAISMFGIFNLQSDSGTSFYSRWNYEYLGAHFWEDPELYRRLSPATAADTVHTPTLILHGDEDENTFIGNSKELYHALRARGVPCQFVHYPREGHGITEPNHRVDEIRRCLQWMDRYVKRESSYRVGDRVASDDETRELRIFRVAPVKFPGRAVEGEDANEPARIYLEVMLGAGWKTPKDELRTLELATSQIVLETRYGAGSETSVLTPCGVSLDLPGGKYLLVGDNLRVTHTTSQREDEPAASICVVFHTASAGDGQVRVEGYSGVQIHWLDADAEGRDVAT